MIRILLLATLACAATPLPAQTPIAENMTLLGLWDDPALSDYSDVWGYAAGGKEYAIVGSRRFYHILDVTDPGNIVELHRVNDYNNTGSEWRDIKVFGDYAYCVVDVRVNEGLRVLNLRDLENTPTEDLIVYSSQADFNRCHNLFIDSTVFPPRLYAFDINTTGSDLQIFSLADPANPVRLNPGGTALTGRDIHDGFVINDTLYANSERRGLYVYDVSNPTNIVELGILSGYPEAGYNHSSWRTDDGKSLVMCDETFGTGVKVVDVSDPADMSVTSIFRSNLLAPAVTNSIAHNPYVISGDRVVISYYNDGVQVWDIKDRARPVRLGYYDTTPNSTRYAFEGNWGAYPYLPSGNILISDIDNGLYVVRLEESILPVTYASWTVEADGKNARLAWSVTRETGNAGWKVEHATAGHDFAEIGFVPAGGADFAFVHQDIGPGEHFYRLRQVDTDGMEHLGEVRSVSLSRITPTSLVFPNPAPASAPLTIRGLAPDADWEVWSADGKLVRRGTGTRLHLRTPPGIYWLRSGNEIVDKIILK